MNNYLERIVAEKRVSLEKLAQDPALRSVLERGDYPRSKRFYESMKQPGLQVIAEIKRRSPSRGEIEAITDPITLAQKYCSGGAGAISVLTDREAFGGSLDDLMSISQAVAVPTLRKDFILHPLQLAEAVLAGSSAVLLIVAVLGENLKPLLQQASALGLEALVEIHTKYELEVALDAGAQIIGVNHRNLKTFETNLNLSEELIGEIPSSVVRIAESGIHTPAHARCMAERGFDAILVGEALVRSTTPSTLIEEMRGAR